MEATREGGSNVINIGQDFVQALSGGYVWVIKADKYTFTVNFECTMDKAIQHVRNLLSKERVKLESQSVKAQRFYQGMNLEAF